MRSRLTYWFFFFRFFSGEALPQIFLLGVSHEPQLAPGKAAEAAAAVVAVVAVACDHI